MNTKAVISAIEHAMERTVNYPSLIEKIAYLDGLAAACEYMGLGEPLLPLKAQWQQIKKCRASYMDEIRDQEIAKREEKERLLTTFPTDDGEDSVFDVVPAELKEEIVEMDLGVDPMHQEY
jgi:hypothetical protein